MLHRGSPEVDGHLLVIPVRAELSQYQELLKMLRFKMGHCAPKIAAINTVSEACGVCTSAFASEIWRPEELEWACWLGFSKYQVALMGQVFFYFLFFFFFLFFFYVSIRPGDTVLIFFFQTQTLLLQATLFSPGVHTAVLHGSGALYPPRKEASMQCSSVTLSCGLRSPPSRSGIFVWRIHLTAADCNGCCVWEEVGRFSFTWSWFWLPGDY